MAADTRSGEVVERISLTEWKDELELLEGGVPSRIYLLNPNTGKLTVLSAKSGATLHTAQLPWTVSDEHRGAAELPSRSYSAFCPPIVDGLRGELLYVVTLDGWLRAYDLRTRAGKNLGRVGVLSEVDMGVPLTVLPGSQRFLVSSDIFENLPWKVYDGSVGKGKTLRQIQSRQLFGIGPDLAGDEDGIWNLVTATRLRLPDDATPSNIGINDAAHDDELMHAVLDARQNRLCVLLSDGHIEIFRIDNGSRLQRLARAAVSIPAVRPWRLVLHERGRYLFWQGLVRSPLAEIPEWNGLFTSNWWPQYEAQMVAVFDLAELNSE